MALTHRMEHETSLADALGPVESAPMHSAIMEDTSAPSTSAANEPATPPAPITSTRTTPPPVDPVSDPARGNAVEPAPVPISAPTTPSKSRSARMTRSQTGSSARVPKRGVPDTPGSAGMRSPKRKRGRQMAKRTTRNDESKDDDAPTEPDEAAEPGVASVLGAENEDAQLPTRPNSPAPGSAEHVRSPAALTAEATLVDGAPVDSPPLTADASSATLVGAGSAEDLDWIPKTKRRARPLPVPVPHLSKKSRGRRVPTTESLASIVSEDNGPPVPPPEPVVQLATPGTSAAGRTYTCQVEGCGKLFSRGEHLKRHVRSLHTYEKPYKCPVTNCGKFFSRHDNLLQHQKVHKETDILSPPPSPATTPEPKATGSRAARSRNKKAKRKPRRASPEAEESAEDADVDDADADASVQGPDASPPSSTAIATANALAHLGPGVRLAYTYPFFLPGQPPGLANGVGTGAGSASVAFAGMGMYGGGMVPVALPAGAELPPGLVSLPLAGMPLVPYYTHAPLGFMPGAYGLALAPHAGAAPPASAVVGPALAAAAAGGDARPAYQPAVSSLRTGQEDGGAGAQDPDTSMETDGGGAGSAPPHMGAPEYALDPSLQPPLAFAHAHAGPLREDMTHVPDSFAMFVRAQAAAAQAVAQSAQMEHVQTSQAHMLGSGEGTSLQAGLQ